MSTPKRTAMLLIAAISTAIVALAPFAGRIADKIRPVPTLKPARIAGPNLAAFDAMSAAWGWT
jgi:hypothetical protein